jgi:hypothetical protein
MKLLRLIPALFAVAAISTVVVVADENHEIIEKVMKEGLKGEESPLATVLEGSATKDEIASLAKLIKTMDGTKAPKGDQGEYDEKVAELIAAMDAVAGGDTGDKALGRLEEASNCKACHTPHKPKKK